ncbi:MAG TPA: Rv3654c family TadE-like protein [Actinospica sp.]|nr:Rv3654c family TadE-like protein [Actinospica sp.]
MTTPNSRRRSEQGSATIWSLSILLLISAATGWALLWLTAESARHSTDRAADSAALAAASAALHNLVMQADSNPCAAAKTAAIRSNADLVGCGCEPLDCTVTVRRVFPLLGPIQASSRAGPVGEAGGDDEP